MDHAPVTRIRVREQEDFQRLYSLILEYADHPERSEHVREFVFRCPLDMGYYYPKTTQDGKPYEDTRDVSDEKTMRNVIQHLSLPQSEEGQWVRVLTWMKPELVEERREIVKADKSPYPYGIEKWFRDRDNEFAHYATALLLTLCPNIETLIYADESRFVFELLRRNNYGLLQGQYLQKLHHVHLLSSAGWPSGDERFYNDMDLIKLLRMFHRLPAIESFQVDAIEPNNDAGFESRLPPQMSNIRKIHVGHNWLTGGIITALIQLPKQLDEFTCTTGGRSTRDGGFFLRSTLKIGQALSRQRGNLRRLDLDIDEHLFTEADRQFYGSPDEADEDEEDELTGDPEERKWYDRDLGLTPGPGDESQSEEIKDYGDTVGSLQNFSQLTHLSIGIELLLGPPPKPGHPHPALADPRDAPFRLIDALPPSLGYLLIRGYTKGKVARYDSHIEELMSLYHERLPNLREIYGVDSCIPSGESVDRPDDNMHLLWEPEPIEDSWKTTDDSSSNFKS